MTILKDLILIIPQDIIFNVEDSSPKTDITKSKAYAFSNETSCISSFYTRLLPKVKTENVKRIIVECVEDLNESDRIKIGAGIATIQVKLDYQVYFSSEETEKKRIASKLIREGLIYLSLEKDGDSKVFEEIYLKIEELQYKNKYIYKKKYSPNRKYVCNVVCEHEIDFFSIFLEIADNKEGEIISRKEIIQVVPHPIIMNKYFGEATWDLNNRVIYCDKFKQNQWELSI
ncbi:MAG: hypothetical protein Q8936_22265 [Bacillota bacterium]|nr:hypothetical protein [Bacillota bacterium]